MPDIPVRNIIYTDGPGRVQESLIFLNFDDSGLGRSAPAGMAIRIII